jgi:hypothetical protein
MTSKKKMDKPTQTPQNDPKKKLQYPFRFSTENLHKTTQIKTKIKKSSQKIILTQLPIT